MSEGLEKLNAAISETALRAFDAGLNSLQMMVEIAGVQYHVEFKMELAADYLARISCLKIENIEKLDSIGE